MDDLDDQPTPDFGASSWFNALLEGQDDDFNLMPPPPSLPEIVRSEFDPIKELAVCPLGLKLHKSRTFLELVEREISASISQPPTPVQSKNESVSMPCESTDSEIVKRKKATNFHLIALTLGDYSR